MKKTAAAIFAGCVLLSASCSTSSAASTSGLAPAGLPTQGTASSGSLNYSWHMDHTSSGSGASRYSVDVTTGWAPHQISADIIAAYIADNADFSFGPDAPITLTIICSSSGKRLATGTYTRNSSIAISWSDYTDTASSCG